MLGRLFKKKDKEDIFWDWFSQNADDYFHFEKDQNKLFAQLKDQLKKIHPDLVFEFSPIFKDGTREFVISADGIKSVFPIVSNLVAKAPKLKNWKVIAFRQPHKNVTQIKYQNLVVNFDDVFFRYGKDNGKIALELNIRGFYESPEWTAATFILLDNILGEYHTEMSLSSIDKKELKEAESNDLFPIRSLPKVIQDYQLEFNN
jgi:hypothetical protein